jgi:hypothetical protein
MGSAKAQMPLGVIAARLLRSCDGCCEPSIIERFTFHTESSRLYAGLNQRDFSELPRTRFGVPDSGQSKAVLPWLRISDRAHRLARGKKHAFN